jgi:hypothetical protein
MHHAVPVKWNSSAEDPIEFERESVHCVYEAIASHFHSTRYKAWPRVEDFIRAIPVGSICADVGCGNGKYMGLNKSSAFVGCDRYVST